MVVANCLDSSPVEGFYLRFDHVQAFGQLGMYVSDGAFAVEGPAEAAFYEHRNSLGTGLGASLGPAFCIERGRKP
jgi:hypothetical protein